MVKVVSMDAWLAYRKVIRRYCRKEAICFDHFYLVKHFSKAINRLRVEEVIKAHKEHKEVYKRTGWLLLKQPEKLHEVQEISLQTLISIKDTLYKVYILWDEFR